MGDFYSMRTVCGIYKIENSLNNKIYIGQSTNVFKRWGSHISDSFNENSKDYDMVIHKAFRKYKLNNFIFSIIEECKQEDLNEREIYWIDFYNSYSNGYNASKGGDNYEHLGEAVELYDFDGNFIKEYPSILKTAEELNVSYQTVCQVIYGQRKSCRNFQLKLKKDSKKIGRYTSNQGGKKVTYKLDNDYNIVGKYESVNEAARLNNIDSSSIAKCCNGKLKHCGGFGWCYEENYNELFTD